MGKKRKDAVTMVHKFGDVTSMHGIPSLIKAKSNRSKVFTLSMLYYHASTLLSL